MHVSKRGWFLFAALGIIWGTPYLFIRVAVESVSPAVIVCGRMGLAIILLLPFAWKERPIEVFRKYWKGILFLALAEMVLPFGALSVAEKNISSSLAGLIVAAVPITTGLMLRAISHDDQWDKRRVVGLVVGMLGIVSLVGLDVRADNWWSIALCFLAVIGYAMGPIIIAIKLVGAPDLATIVMAQALAFLIYLPVLLWEIVHDSWRTAEAQEFGVPLNAWLSVLGLGVLCTAIAFSLLFKLIAEVGPSRAPVITYINPAVAILLGVLLLNEPFTRGMAFGFPLVLLGSVLATRKQTQEI
jgi:drug/metabolite transporter (DMT)-like permease